MSFRHALEGILAAITREKHLRFHIVIANLIVLFAIFYGLSGTEWAILMLTSFAVISAEIFNTAVECAVDTATQEIKPTAKLAKDAAAGAVLCLCIGAVIVGYCLFGDFHRIWETLVHIFTNWEILVPCLAIGIIDVLFLIIGGKDDRKL